MKSLINELKIVAKELNKRVKAENDYYDPMQDFMNLVSKGPYKNKDIATFLKKYYYVDPDFTKKTINIDELEDMLEEDNYGTEADLLRVLNMGKEKAIEPILEILKIRNKSNHLPMELSAILRFLVNPKLFKQMAQKGVITEKYKEHLVKSKEAKSVFRLMDDKDYSDFAEILGI